MWLNFEQCLVIYVARLTTRKDSLRMMHLETENWSGGWWQPEPQSGWWALRPRTEVGADGNQRFSQDDASWGWELNWGLMTTRASVRMMGLEAENWSGGWWKPEIQSGWCVLRLRTEVGADGNQRPTKDDAYWGWELKRGLMATRDPLRMMHLEAENWSGGRWQPEIQSGWCILRLRTEVGAGGNQRPTQDDESWGWELKWGQMATRDSVRMMRLEVENWSGGWWQPEIRSGWCVLRLRTEVGADGNQRPTQDDASWGWELKWGPMAAKNSVRMMHLRLRTEVGASGNQRPGQVDASW